MAGHYRVATVEIALRIAQMHGAALAMAAAGRLPEELGHHLTGTGPTGQGIAVIAIMAENMVPRFQGVDRANRDRLLANIEMEEAANLSRRVHFRALLLEAANEEHLPVEIHQASRLESLQSTFLLLDAQSRHVLPAGVSCAWPCYLPLLWYFCPN